jgi:hypothetical protein
LLVNLNLLKKKRAVFFVNDPYKSGYLHHAVMAAYDGILKDGAQPSYFFIFDRAAKHHRY